MKPIPAIVEREADGDIAKHAQAVDQAIGWLREAQRHAEAAESRAQTAREAAAKMRLELGRRLIAARKCWPASGPRAKGWTDFLAVRRLDVTVALDAMRYAGYVDEQSPGTSPDAPGNLPTMREAGLDNRPRQSDAPHLELVPDPDPEVEIDRDTWCTPQWLTQAIGEFDLDPCSNDRSTVPARMQLRLDFGQDGLTGADVVHADQRVFINPPYSDVQPWIAAYKHTRFCFLLKLDTSTRWFAELYAASALILIPRRRVNFIPPPGVPDDKAVAQQFPHALFYAHAEDATDAIRALCWTWRVEH